MATIYLAQFARPQGTNIYFDQVGAGPLVVAHSGRPREDATPPAGPLLTCPETGLELRISRMVPDEAPGVSVDCRLSAVNLPTMFTMSLHGRIENLSPCAFPSLWAPSVGVRATDKFAGATHQLRNPLRGVPFPSNPLRPPGQAPPVPDPPGVHIALGAGLPDMNSVTPRIADEVITPIDAYPNWMEGRFELQTFIDTTSRSGRSRLMTSGHQWMERSWTFTSFPPITDVAFGLTVAHGLGTAKATILDFSISQ